MLFFIIYAVFWDRRPLFTNKMLRVEFTTAAFVLANISLYIHSVVKKKVVLKFPFLS